MKTKLTLRMDENLIARAKIYSNSHNKSLSQIVADYFTLLTSEHVQEDADNEPLDPWVASLVGAFGTDQTISEDDYYRYLEQKYV